MSVLNIDDNGFLVPVVELGPILNKQQVILGNYDRDLILRTSGNIKIQIKNKFYDLNVSDDSVSSAGSSKILVLNNLIGLSYPGDGFVIYTTDDKKLFITVSGQYVPLLNENGTAPIDPQKIFLSFTDTQELTGIEKSKALHNAGLVLGNFSEIIYLSTDKVYANQVIFAGDTKRFYGLNNIANPSEYISWDPLFVNRSGDTITGNIFIETKKDAGNATNVSLHVLSSENRYGIGTSTANQFNGLFIGAKDLTSGLGLYDSPGDASFITSQTNTIKFLTNGTGDPFNPLTLNEDTVGINGSVPSGYQFGVKGNTYLNGRTTVTDSIKSDDYVPGPTGSGFSMYKDNGKWTLEVDYLKVRNSSEFAGEVNDTKGLNGSLMLDFSLVVKDLQLYETMDIYTRAIVSGKYKDTFGTNVPWNERGTRVNGIRTTISGLTDPNDGSVDPPAAIYGPIDLAFGIGDMDSSNTPTPGTTYLRDSSGVYKTIVGNTSYDSTTNSFIPDNNGTLVNTGIIYVYNIPNTVTVSVGDLFYYKRWSKNKVVDGGTVKFVEVVKVLADSIYVYAYNSPLVEGSALIKVGNRYSDIHSMEINSGDQVPGFIQSFKGIRSFNEMIPSYYANDINDGSIIYPADILNVDPKIPMLNVDTKWGSLTGITDVDLGLTTTNNTPVGLFAKNAFVEGNFVGHKMILGTELNYNNGVLWIKDLETIKSRNITGAEGLRGGGNLFASDIIIKHNAKTWIDKTALTGGNVISNILVDAYGHPTDWTTRLLTTSDIVEGTNLYYTDVRTDNRINIQKGVPNGIVPLDSETKINIVYLPDSILGGMRYQGSYNPITNTPVLPSPSITNKGYYYIIDTAGSIDGVHYAIGDWTVSNGVTWDKIDNTSTVTNIVTSVFGRIGNIVANAGDYNTSLIPENTNLYFTNARVNAIAPTLTGVGASGTWNINITGNASTASGLGIYSWNPTVLNNADYLYGRNGLNEINLISQTGVRTFLGLGPFAYRNSINGNEVITSPATLSTDIGVATYLRWNNYGNGHVIFDASKGIAPNGSTIPSNTNSQNTWIPTHPTLMGWNGSNTYGVRVDVARAADVASVWANAGSYVNTDVVVNTYMMGLGADTNWHPIGKVNLGNFLGEVTPIINSIVKRDVNGYIEANFFKSTTSANAPQSSTPSSLYGNAIGNDGFHYSYTSTAVKNFLGLTAGNYVTKNIDSISATGSADTQRGNLVTFAYATSGAPFDGTLLSVGGFQGGGYDLQINSSYSDTGQLAFRNRNGDANTWGNWRKILFNGYDTEGASLAGGSGTSFSTATLQLYRHVNTGTAPNLAFHWAGSVASNISIAADGRIVILNNPGTGYEGLVASTLTATSVVTGSRGAFGYDPGIDGSVGTSNWFRSQGNSGWYNDTYRGGIVMLDNTYVRVHGDKDFYANKRIMAGGGFKCEGPLGMMGDYDANGVVDKIIWTIGDQWNTLATIYGLGYSYNGSIRSGMHQIVVSLNGTQNISLGMDGVIIARSNISAGSGTDGGFQNIAYTAGHNNIWRLGNAIEYGIAYYQGSGTDYVGIHFISRNTPQHTFAMSGNAAHTGTLVANGIGLSQTTGVGQGLSLYGGSPGNTIPTYGIAFAQTTNFGTYGDVSGDWATYFTMVGGVNRGWVFRNNDAGNVASISARGSMSLAGSMTAAGGGFNSHRYLKDIHHFYEGDFNALSAINQLQIRKFNYKTDPSNNSLGLIIDEIPKDLKEILLINNDSVDLYSLHAISLLAHKETNNEIERLKRRVTELERKLESYG